MDIEKLKAELKRDEGVCLEAYRCSSGHWTLGVGHSLTARGVKANIAQKMTCTTSEAEKWLEEDITDATETAKKWLGSVVFEALTDARQRVVVNMAFNMGKNLLQFQNTKRHIINCDWVMAAYHMEESRWARQVGKRAKRLAKMMREG